MKSFDIIVATLLVIGGQDAGPEVGGALRVADARVVSPNVAAGNGVIHVIDSVLLPE